MARSNALDWANLASTAYQNRQLAYQTAQNNTMIGQMATQLAVEGAREIRHQNIVKKRKMVVKLDRIAKKTEEVSKAFPEYSLMMTKMNLGIIDDMGLEEDDFEEIGDMRAAEEMNTSLKSVKTTIQESLTEKQISDSSKMTQFILNDQNEMNLLEQHCIMNEEWQENSEEWATIVPQYEKQVRNIAILKWIFFILYIGSGTTISEESMDSFSAESMPFYFFGVTWLILFFGNLPKPTSRERHEELSKMNKNIEEIKDSYQSLSTKYGISNSKEIADEKITLMKWVQELTPDEEPMHLSV
jgi:hypothetical protein